MTISDRDTPVFDRVRRRLSGHGFARLRPIGHAGPPPRRARLRAGLLLRAAGWRLQRVLRGAFPPAAVMLGLLVSGTAAAATLKIATLSPEGSVWMKMLRDGGAQVEADTGGRVSFKFYPGGVMGDDKAVLRKIRVGQLHGAVVTAGALVQNYPDIGLYSLPMAFRSGSEADYVRGRMDVGLLAGLEGEGLRCLRHCRSGVRARHVASRDHQRRGCPVV